MNYYYIHTISYFVGNNRLDNILHCINNLNKIKYSVNNKGDEKILLVVCCIYDNLIDTITEQMEKIKKQTNPLLDIEIIYRWNTGGTIKTMENTLDFIIKKDITCNYIGIFEDDSFFNKEYIFDEVDYLLKKGINIIGCQVKEERPDILHTNGYKIFKEEYWTNKLKNRLCPWIKEKHVYINNNKEELIHDKYVKWIDGALYITTIDNLIKIKEKMIKFTLAPETEKYTHIEHGINYGEVGFPTRLSINGFSFFGLSHNNNNNDHFKYLNLYSVGNKLK